MKLPNFADIKIAFTKAKLQIHDQGYSLNKYACIAKYVAGHFSGAKGSVQSLASQCIVKMCICVCECVCTVNM